MDYTGFLKELNDRLSPTSDPFSHRDRLLNTAIEIAGDSATGFGLGSFGRRRSPQKSRGKLRLGARIGWSSKGTITSHLTGTTYLRMCWSSAGGLVFPSIMVFLTVLLVYLGRRLATEHGRIGMLVVAVIGLAGLGQSTLHVEHGQLAFVCLGWCVVSLEALANAE